MSSWLKLSRRGPWRLMTRKTTSWPACNNDMFHPKGEVYIGWCMHTYIDIYVCIYIYPLYTSCGSPEAFAETQRQVSFWSQDGQGLPEFQSLFRTPSQESIQPCALPSSEARQSHHVPWPGSQKPPLYQRQQQQQLILQNKQPLLKQSLR